MRRDRAETPSAASYNEANSIWFHAGELPPAQEQWRPNYPNPAFRNRLPDDNFWAVETVMAFTTEQIRAIVHMEQYSNAADEELVVCFLTERRYRIEQKYFKQVFDDESGSSSIGSKQTAGRTPAEFSRQRPLRRAPGPDVGRDRT